jgi:multidrug efflux pump subunit AcrA (membrane-fusion protein)
MELSVQSPRDGAVAEVLVAAGDQVARGQALVALESPSSQSASPDEAERQLAEEEVG